MSDTAKARANSADLDVIRDDIEALRKDLARLMEHVKSGAFQNIAGRIEEMSDDARRLYNQAFAEGERRADALARQVEERPLTSLLIAFSLGFLGSRLVLR
jgi:polyhydroxyalkanoate synthesis regulator phasin